MKVISPIVLTDARLAAHSIAEPDIDTGEVEWVSGTSYSVGQEVIRTDTHRIYRRIVAGAGTTAPELDTTNWEDVRPTNRWAMFDESVGTITTATGDGGAVIQVTIEPGQSFNAISFFELGAQTVQVEVLDSPGGTVVYDTTVNLDETEMLDWYSYFFEPFSLRTTLVLTDLPPYALGQIRITITGPSTTTVGNVVFGTAYEVGSTGYGATAGIRDYSRKTENPDTGVITLERRKFAKIMRARFRLSESQVNFTHRLLSGLRSTPCVWIGDNGAGLEPLIVYGFYRDFSLELETAKISYYSLEIEGMV